MDQTVTIRRFLYRHEAELARSYLEASEIPSWVLADDAGGMQPQLNFAQQGVRLLTDEAHAQEAIGLLDALESDASAATAGPDEAG